MTLEQTILFMTELDVPILPASQSSGMPGPCGSVSAECRTAQVCGRPIAGTWRLRGVSDAPSIRFPSSRVVAHATRVVHWLHSQVNRRPEMITIRMTEANARWMFACAEVNCRALANQEIMTTDPAKRAEIHSQWLERDELRDELLTVLGDLDEKAQAGTMTPTEGSERRAVLEEYPDLTGPGLYHTS